MCSAAWPTSTHTAFNFEALIKSFDGGDPHLDQAHHRYGRAVAAFDGRLFRRGRLMDTDGGAWFATMQAVQLAGGALLSHRARLHAYAEEVTMLQRNPVGRTSGATVNGSGCQRAHNVPRERAR